MTDTTKRAELLAIADQIDLFIKHGTDAIFEQNDAMKIASALRRLASQDQKPVAHPYVKNIDGSPLYLSPPPAAGWDEAIEAVLDEISGGLDVIRWIKIWESGGKTADEAVAVGFYHQALQDARAAVEALRHNAPPDSGATKSAPPGRSSLPPNQGESEHAVTCASGEADAGVRVKPLEWHQHSDGETKRYEGVAVIGNNYTVVQAPWGAKNKWGWVGGDKFYHSETEARMACNTDYKRRILSALSHQPAAAETTASAEARLRGALEVSGDAIDEYYRYWTGGESRGSYDGRPERANLWKAMYAVRAALKALPAHPHASDCAGETEDDEWATRLSGDETTNWQVSDETLRRLASDCDKQECMGDASPGDAKDLQELLSKPSVLEPSDRTADVTVEQAARKCADDLVLIVEAATKMARRTGNTFVIDRARVASMIAGHFNAFTVGRR